MLCPPGCSPDVELLDVLIINSTQELGQGGGVAMGEGSTNDVCPECVDFGTRTLNQGVPDLSRSSPFKN